MENNPFKSRVRITCGLVLPAARARVLERGAPLHSRPPRYVQSTYLSSCPASCACAGPRARRAPPFPPLAMYRARTCRVVLPAARARVPERGAPLHSHPTVCTEHVPVELSCQLRVRGSQSAARPSTPPHRYVQSTYLSSCPASCACAGPRARRAPPLPPLAMYRARTCRVVLPAARARVPERGAPLHSPPSLCTEHVPVELSCQLRVRGSQSAARPSTPPPRYVQSTYLSSCPASCACAGPRARRAPPLPPLAMYRARTCRVVLPAARARVPERGAPLHSPPLAMYRARTCRVVLPAARARVPERGAPLHSPPSLCTEHVPVELSCQLRVRGSQSAARPSTPPTDRARTVAMMGSNRAPRKDTFSATHDFIGETRLSTPDPRFLIKINIFNKKKIEDVNLLILFIIWDTSDPIYGQNLRPH
ncbi:unnamed protein product [Arctia plantaginis]|uniref:Uncharacterized protein n=1 Tax=Arctia plantaginis TaxID=874455 RepID=A0A8S1B776_ARCPL|nr:unnamed protein product [Arctia plantaginis]